MSLMPPKRCHEGPGKQGFEQNLIDCKIYFKLRYNGTDCALMTLKPEGENNWDFSNAFAENYKCEFGFHLPDRDIIKLPVGTTVSGPAITMDGNSAILIQQFSASLIASSTVVITIGDGHKGQVTTEMDLAMLAVFGSRFMLIAEQMGRTLQKTAIGANIKERLDFS
ncbi:hypothetical protein EDD21DRAFT_421373 [Dissophora ornata]|nr:hypothetical protein EDD21DRAFT_421373 [Dissophora ornata]